jgi:hypothetical protein
MGMQMLSQRDHGRHQFMYFRQIVGHDMVVSSAMMVGLAVG